MPRESWYPAASSKNKGGRLPFKRTQTKPCTCSKCCSRPCRCPRACPLPPTRAGPCMSRHYAADGWGTGRCGVSVFVPARIQGRTRDLWRRCRRSYLIELGFIVMPRRQVEIPRSAMEARLEKKTMRSAPPSAWSLVPSVADPGLALTDD